MNTKNDLQAKIEQKLPSYLQFLQSMIEQNSHTQHAAGVNAVGKIVAERFAQLGFAAERIAAPGFGGHLFLKRTGQGSRSVAFVAHLDTVFSASEEQANHFQYRLEGERLYGPGAIDIKGGIALVLAVLEALAEASPSLFEQTTWHFGLNSHEELLTPHFSEEFLRRIPPDPQLPCLVVEPGNVQGERFALVSCRRGRRTFRVTAEGRGAHAGLDFERGINAILALSRFVAALSELSEPARGLTVNVGSFVSEGVPNRVPQRAVAEFEARAFENAELDAVAQKALKIAHELMQRTPESERPQLMIEQTSSSPAWIENERTERLLQIWERAAAELSLPVCRERRRGGSDGNFLWEHYALIDGLGPSGANAHCSEQDPARGKEQEFMNLPSFSQKAALAVRALQLLLS